MPSFTSRCKLLTQGWHLNTLVTAHSGLPINFRAGTSASGDGDTFDRIDLIGDPFANVLAATSAATVPYLNRAVFNTSVAGTTAILGGNAIYRPAFAQVDQSLFKDFPIREKLKALFRMEVFNVFKRTNSAKPTSTFNSGSFGLIGNTRNRSGGAGPGFGEPRNIQFAVKLLW